MACLPAILAAQEKPLSAIDWLEKAPLITGDDLFQEPPVAPGVARPEISVQPLERAPRVVGLVSAETTGLPQSLWAQSDPATLTRLIANTPVARSPSMQRLLFTLLLTETHAPTQDRSDEVLAARVARLIDLGAAEPALALLDAAAPITNPKLFRLWFDASLLTGDEGRACQMLSASVRLLPDDAARIYCAVLGADWSTAALLLETAHALNTLPEARLNLLDRFLSPEVFEGAPALQPPTDLTALDVRLFEAIGESLPTTSLPRRFAPIDLRDVAGWKAQIEAAERLVRTGALEPNRLLGLYTERRAAASGGVWDRVRAVQQFEAALEPAAETTIDDTLPAVWAQMRTVGLEVAFARLFANKLAGLTFENSATRKLAWRVGLLSSEYETIAARLTDDDPNSRFLIALAQGRPQDVTAPSAKAQAVARAFSKDVSLPLALVSVRDQAKLGEYILLAMTAFDRGVQGDLNELEHGLAALRAVGLEDIVRRAALHVLLTGRDSL